MSAAVLCFQYKKLFPLGYEYVENKHKYESSPLKEQCIVHDVEDMVRYEFSLLVPREQIKGLIERCLCFPERDGRTIWSYKELDVFRARKIIDGLCTRCYARWKIENSTQIMASRATHLCYKEVETSYNATLGYDYMYVESPIISEYRLIQKEKQKKAEEAYKRVLSADERMIRELRLDNDCYFQIQVTEEQKRYAKKLVESSMIQDFEPTRFRFNPDGKKMVERERYRGTLGEVVYADTYELPRPKFANGSFDAKEYGQKFLLANITQYIVCPKTTTIKTLQRDDNVFYDNNVLRITKDDLSAEYYYSDYYGCICFHEDDETTIATFVGLINKESVMNGEIGNICLRGTRRTRKDCAIVIESNDTYEIMLKEIDRPILTNRIKNLPGFEILRFNRGVKKNLFINLYNNTSYTLLQK